MNTVYVAMCADVIHRGHINLLKNAAQHGRVVVGLLSDSAVASFKRVPFMAYQDRLSVVQNLRYVDEVIQQDATTPAPYIEQMQPEVFVHGDDWCNGRETFVRDSVVAALDAYGGKLVEVPYTKGVSSTSLQTRLRRHEIETGHGSKRLSAILKSKKISRGCSVKSLTDVPDIGAVKVERKSFDFISFGFSPSTDPRDMNLYFEAVKFAEIPVLFDCRGHSAYIKEVLERSHIVGSAGFHVDLKALMQDEDVLESLLEATGFDSQLLVVTATPSELSKLLSSSPKVLDCIDVLLARVETKEEARSADQGFRNICSATSIATGYEIANPKLISEDALHVDDRSFVVLHSVDVPGATTLLEQIQTVRT
ncbi:adenylyltransferase/cytidyltransferase family protein [Pseudovibrio ascidiaceicola]|uniref:adenylyltransferase/cytidyltransferase family protein n=1 Tax=Pseudovibrio ascidiaceicola TaxID=285279 RepID=UPI003D35E2DD